MSTKSPADPVPSDDRATVGGIEELYLSQAPAMVRLAFLLTHDAELAEDVFQDAFLKVTGRFGHLRSIAAFDHYLRRAVVNLCLSHHRHAKVERRYLAIAGTQRLREGDPQSHGTDHETRDEVISAIATLPVRQRAVVVLRFYEDLSEQQTADAMGCSAVAARSLLARAMQSLRERLGTGVQISNEEDGS